mmetsp:Transcript_33036/g.77242  ORF Transcript_33036/g.77242 Transcript_33036/m.77242 type:complete len:247 (-) Transcript_33036:3707-4447(-)
MVMLCSICHFEQLSSHLNVSTLANSLCVPLRQAGADALQLQDGVDYGVLIPHEVADLLQDAHHGIPVEVHEATFQVLVHGSLLCNGRGHAEALGILVLAFLGLPSLALLRLCLAFGTLLLHLLWFGSLHWLLLQHVDAHLCHKRCHSPVGLWPIQRQPVIHLTGNDFHELRTSLHVEPLELEMILGGQTWAVQSLSHCDEHLCCEVNMPQVGWNAMQNGKRLAFICRCHDVVMVVLDCGHVLPQCG